MSRAFCTSRPTETSDEIRRNMFLAFDEQERQGESPQSPNSAAPRYRFAEERLWRNEPWDSFTPALKGIR
jgi:hypothetical protein